MLDLDLMRSVAMQMMDGTAVNIAGKVIAVRRTSSSRLKFVQFAMNGREYQAIEQNAAKPSRWGELARQGHRVAPVPRSAHRQIRGCLSRWPSDRIRPLIENCLSLLRKLNHGPDVAVVQAQGASFRRHVGQSHL